MDTMRADAAEKRRETEGRIDSLWKQVDSAEELIKEKADLIDKMKE